MSRPVAGKYPLVGAKQAWRIHGFSLVVPVFVASKETVRRLFRLWMNHHMSCTNNGVKHGDIFQKGALSRKDSCLLEFGFGSFSKL